VTSANLPALRGYQQDAVAAIERGLTTGSRGQMWAACGTGKTVVALHAARRLCPAGLVVVACPSLPLIAQTMRVWLNAGVVAHMLAVCGDDSVGDAATRVADLPCTVTTDSTEISRWVKALPAGEPALVMVTHVSADVLGDGLRQAGTAAELLVVDEAHHTAGWSGKHNAAIHQDERLPARRRLYMTATPRRLIKQRSRKGEDLMSMDDPDLFGPVQYKYPFSQAISDGWLDDYQVLVIGVTCAEALALLRKADNAAITDELDAPLRTAATQAALIRAAGEFGLRRIIVFTSRIAQSREFARTLPRTLAMLAENEQPKGPLTVAHIDGTQSTQQRELALSWLADPPSNGWTTVVNARCLQEGVDVPAVDCVVYTQPKESETDIIQSVGRALRRHAGGSGIATILVPALLPDEPDELSADATEWMTPLRVLRALRSHDGDMATELDTQRAHACTDGEVALPQRILLRLPDHYRTDQLLRQITVQILEGTTSDWIAGYTALKAFHARHGHLQIPEHYRENGIKVHRWLTYQRTLAKKGRLPADRRALLAELGVFITPFQRGLAAATRFYDRHGHLRVPDDYRDDGVHLAQWLTTRRSEYRAEQLDAAKVAALTAIGMHFKPNRSIDEGFAAAQAFYDQHGHLNVARGTIFDGLDLYVWLDRRRTDQRANRLSAEDKARLDAMGMIWEPARSRWQMKFEALHRYHEQHGRLPPSGTAEYRFIPRWSRLDVSSTRSDSLQPSVERPFAWCPRPVKLVTAEVSFRLFDCR